MAYIDESLSAGEEISALFAQHWMVRIPMFIWLLLSPFFGLTLPLAIYEYLRVRYTELGLTNKRVICKTGIISRKSEEMKLTSIETVEIDQGMLGRILGFGNIHVSGRGISDVVLRNVKDPMAIKRAIESVSNPVS